MQRMASYFVVSASVRDAVGTWATLPLRAAIAATKPDRFAAQLTRGAAVTPELAMTEMRRVLGIRDVPSVGVGAR